ncbi:RidA family protein [Paracraurococcus ruber]|uniref:Enamine deaminase RidA n=1 Tax=Paracraurococcus ruber TaxID=77675 RepID=A0ABS1CYW0_9PROT|nr:RidA family protein [Paracraurococcus ruber]MBK1659697.1 enamine deaminase RidA [Paracraurococcus ruber]TDG30414.1 RidA family protein [Paracraurococcus ruber]
MKEIIEVPVISDTIRRTGVPLSPVVRANGFVFVSGLPGIDLVTGKIVQGGIEAQTEASLAAVRHALEAAGSSLEKVVKVTIYCANSAWFAKINAIYARYFAGEAPPARTFVAVGSWPLEFDIEIECVALA